MEEKLRKCKFKEYKGGSEYIHRYGYFHRFGTDYEEFEDGVGSYTVGIVECTDGTVYMPIASNIQFLPDDFDINRGGDINDSQ